MAARRRRWPAATRPAKSPERPSARHGAVEPGQAGARRPTVHGRLAPRRLAGVLVAAPRPLRVHVTRVGQHAWRGLPASHASSRYRAPCSARPSHAHDAAIGRGLSLSCLRILVTLLPSHPSVRVCRGPPSRITARVGPRRPSRRRLRAVVWHRFPLQRLHRARGHQTLQLGPRRTLSLAPTLRSRKGAGRVDCVLERPRAPACALSSFHTPSKLPSLFQNVSSFRTPRDACNLMM
jgi:hypothetical protein